jgi:hypothetical protein
MQKRQQLQAAEAQVVEEEMSMTNYLAGMWDFGGGLFDDDADAMMDIATLLPEKVCGLSMARGLLRLGV